MTSWNNKNKTFQHFENTRPSNSASDNVSLQTRNIFENETRVRLMRKFYCENKHYLGHLPLFIISSNALCLASSFSLSHLILLSSLRFFLRSHILIALSSARCLLNASSFSFGTNIAVCTYRGKLNTLS